MVNQGLRFANHNGFYEKTYTFNSNVDGQSISTDACNLVIRIPQSKSPNLLKRVKIDNFGYYQTSYLYLSNTHIEIPHAGGG